MRAINIQQNTIIISIPCFNEEPFEKLQNIKKGILSAIANIDFNEAPALEIQNGISTLCELLKNAPLLPIQNDLSFSIPFGNEEPFEKLQSLQNGILSVIKNIDFNETPSLEVQNCISTLTAFLQNMQLSYEQLEKNAA